jgi:hypothetical protein
MTAELTKAERYALAVEIANGAARLVGERGGSAIDLVEVLFVGSVLMAMNNRRPHASRESAVRILEPLLRGSIQTATNLDLDE